MAPAQVSVFDQDIESMLAEPQRLKEYARELVAKYVSDPQNGLQDLHPGLNVANHIIRIDTEETEVPESVPSNVVNSDVKAEEDTFVVIMKEYEEKVKEKYRTGVDVDKVHTMEQVWEVVDESIDKYQNDDVKGFWGRIRSAFRKIGEHNKALEGWLGLIPSESHYLSSVCGGLKMVLKAAARLHDIREEVLQGLQDIPLILNGAQRVLAIYKDSEKLRICSSSLYVSTLKALGHMLHYLRRKCVSKTFKALIQQSSFEFSLTEKLQDMERSRDMFNREATICSQEMMKKVQEVSQDTQTTVYETTKQLSSIKALLEIGVQEQIRVQLFIRAGLKLQDDRFNAIMRRQSDLEQKMTGGFDKTQEILNALLLMLQANPQTEAEVYFSHTPFTNTVLLKHNFISFKAGSDSIKNTKYSHNDLKEVLLSRLDFEISEPTADAAANFNLGATLPREEKQRCMHVIQSAALAQWINTKNSIPIIINGNSTEAWRQSALSFVCARLVHTFNQIRSQDASGHKKLLISTHYFCGLHQDYKNTRKPGKDSPTGVANSILAQLLMACGSHVDLIPVIKLGDFEDTKLKDVCKRFEAVLEQLPDETVVFCVIDGLSFYLDVDDERMAKDAQKLLQWLVGITRIPDEGHGRCIFKLLITAPIRLHGRIEDLVDEGETLNLPQRVQSIGGYTDTKWDAGMKGIIEGSG